MQYLLIDTEMYLCKLCTYQFFFQTLVAETLVLAKTHGYVEKIENELEEEIQKETEPYKEDFGK